MSASTPHRGLSFFNWLLFQIYLANSSYNIRWIQTYNEKGTSSSFACNVPLQIWSSCDVPNLNTNYLWHKWTYIVKIKNTHYVTTLALSSQLKQKGSQGHMPKRVWEWRLTLPNELSFWELESQWTPEFLESDCRGQNTFHWKFLYIIGKLLNCRCLKWARMIRLDIYNTSYGKKKGRESNLQFDSQPQKIGNWPTFVCADGVRHIVRKLLTRATTLL